MNHREPPHLPGGMRRALHCLSILLLPAMGPEQVHALPRTRPLGSGPNLRNAVPLPYLPKIGSLPLRFHEAPAPVKVAVPAPAPVAVAVVESSVAVANAAAAQSTVAAEPVEPVQPAPQPTEPAPSPAPAKEPPPILPDTVRPTVRPEDFLPFFQIPGSARVPSDVTLIVPAAPSAAPAGAVPSSSANYTQTK